MNPTPAEPIKEEVHQDPTTPRSEQKQVHVIFNPVSGTANPEDRKARISEALDRFGYTCQFILTSKEETATALAQRAVRDGADLIVVAGGDGTVMEAMTAVVGTDIPVAVVPSGTGNLLSVNLGIPSAVPDAIEVALSGKPYKLDLARSADDRYFAIMGGIGLDAQMIAGAGREAKKRLGVFAYFLAALKNVARPRPRVRIRFDDGAEESHVVTSVLIANMGKITGGLEAVPTASPNDGKLDVCVVRSATLGQWLRLLGYALLGRTQHDPDVDVRQVRKITLRTARSERMQMDGEDEGEVTELTVEVVHHAVTIMLPETASAAHDAAAPPEVMAEREAASRLVPAIIVAVIAALAVAGIAWRRRNH